MSGACWRGLWRCTAFHQAGNLRSCSSTIETMPSSRGELRSSERSLAILRSMEPYTAHPADGSRCASHYTPNIRDIVSSDGGFGAECLNTPFQRSKQLRTHSVNIATSGHPGMQLRFSSLFDQILGGIEPFLSLDSGIFWQHPMWSCSEEKVWRQSRANTSNGNKIFKQL